MRARVAAQGAARRSMAAEPGREGPGTTDSNFQHAIPNASPHGALNQLGSAHQVNPQGIVPTTGEGRAQPATPACLGTRPSSASIGPRTHFGQPAVNQLGIGSQLNQLGIEGLQPAPAAGASQSMGRDEPIGGGELRRRLFHARGPGKTSMSAEDAEALRAIQEDIFFHMNPGGGAPAEEAPGDEGGRPGRSGQRRHPAGEDPLEEPLAESNISGSGGRVYQSSLDGYSPFEHNDGGAAR